MTALLCKNCGKRHYGRCPLWDFKDFPNPTSKTVDKPVDKRVYMKPVITMWAKSVDKCVDKAERRREYQKEWARKKRRDQ